MLGIKRKEFKKKRKILSNNFNRIELLERKIEKLEELTSELVEKRSTLISTNQSQSIS